jgi:hypothetical protein
MITCRPLLETIPESGGAIMNKITAFSLLAVLVIPPVAVAQTDAELTAEPTADMSADTTITGFDALSPGNKMIARAIMDAQITTGEGGEVWTLDQIAAARAQTGWGEVFAQMQADGVIEARNLGEVVSAYVRSTHGALPESLAAELGISADAAAATRGPDTRARARAGADTDTGVAAGAGRGRGADVSVSTAGGARGTADNPGLSARGRISVSASDGVSTAAGGVVDGGANHARTGSRAGLSTATAGNAGTATAAGAGGVSTGTGINAGIGSAAAGIGATTGAGVTGKGVGRLIGGPDK